MQDCVSGFVQAGKQFFSRGPPGPADRRTEGTQANHIPVSDLPGGRCGLKASRTKTGPLSSRRAVELVHHSLLSLAKYLQKNQEFGVLGDGGKGEL